MAVGRARAGRTALPLYLPTTTVTAILHCCVCGLGCVADFLPTPTLPTTTVTSHSPGLQNKRGVISWRARASRRWTGMLRRPFNTAPPMA